MAAHKRSNARKKVVEGLNTPPVRFTRGTWNYFEDSHGKGAPDGVGGTLKRRADRLVRLGVNIPMALSLYQALMDVALKPPSCGYA
ncbi:hypothetical protein JZ751_000660 [Albula glossodonta]|uniref:Uncharacterized protein n=1 Tax=Albula glossodonta TaxID=121402 RepID=A0A8T2PX26_9TELE|nr:hypothetical protein JZ751_000660 [Albula glossodonta]